MCLGRLFNPAVHKRLLLLVQPLGRRHCGNLSGFSIRLDRNKRILLHEVDNLPQTLEARCARSNQAVKRIFHAGLLHALLFLIDAIPFLDGLEAAEFKAIQIFGIEPLEHLLGHAISKQESVPAIFQMLLQGFALQRLHLIGRIGFGIIHHREQFPVQAINSPLERSAVNQCGKLFSHVTAHLVIIVLELFPSGGHDFTQLVSQSQPQVPLAILEFRNILREDAISLQHVFGSHQRFFFARIGEDCGNAGLGSRERHPARGRFKPSHAQVALAALQGASFTIEDDRHTVKHRLKILIHTEGECGIAPQLDVDAVNCRYHRIHFQAIEDAVLSPRIVGLGSDLDHQATACDDCGLNVMGQRGSVRCGHGESVLDHRLEFHTAISHRGDARQCRKKRCEAKTDLVHVVTGHLIAGTERVVPSHSLADDL